MDLKRMLGKDYADPAITTPMILRACKRLQELTDSQVPVAEVNYVIWDPSGNFGFGEHAAIMLQFGADGNRELLVIDIGRRPADARTKDISVLRVYDREGFIKYTGQGFNSQWSISSLCRSSEARNLASSVLVDLREFINKPPNDPVPWNFNILFNNCARYVQARLGSVVRPELKLRIMTYRVGEIITPTQFGTHLQVCNYFAQQLDQKNVLSNPEVKKVVGDYFKELPDAEKRDWVQFMTQDKLLRTELQHFSNDLTVP